jgi:hypothetical protein
MDADRRSQIAAFGLALLPELQQAVLDSWPELLPAAGDWSEASTLRAEQASRAALEGIVGVFEQGDLDDRTWQSVRDVVLAHGNATIDEAAELLRTVRVVGVELLAGRLVERLGISHEEVYELQQEAHRFCQELISTRDEPDPATLQRVLDELERAGPDLR